ncbi:MAG: BlaI/MecI/CopY family transcriptional regulator [Clostridiales bacterium]|nr:BlaI/MecI/CopY family transcriptional regulator [Clostridiales bacterium]
MNKISDAEWKIMNLLWDTQPRTMMQITKELFEETGWSKHTVITYLKRMEKKKIIHYEQGEKAKLYYTDISREEAIVEEKSNFLHKVFRGNAGLMIETMLEQEGFSDEEIDRLIDLLEKRKGD